MNYNKRFWVHPINSERLLYGKFHTLHFKLKQYPDKFFAFYRMSVSSFEELLSLVGPSIKKEDTQLRCAISEEERLSVTLR
ncbi:hypothetical protein NQ314_012969 [Rhamnusium bicolor]|uniref:Uncharacterized protein n=1 Tax=Rhamnusium bicolor TaxID=1586634 RepID=A0AAV8X917_9CUCU|nr:hypothetical protein NQ314_012969 [Rhamnusium bicolor]